jgi:hypothetical protein
MAPRLPINLGPRFRVLLDSALKLNVVVEEWLKVDRVGHAAPILRPRFDAAHRVVCDAVCRCKLSDATVKVFGSSAHLWRSIVWDDDLSAARAAARRGIEIH